MNGMLLFFGSFFLVFALGFQQSNVQHSRYQGGCKKFCVNGHLAGNCLTLRRSEHDRNTESTIARSY